MPRSTAVRPPKICYFYKMQVFAKGFFGLYSCGNCNDHKYGAGDPAARDITVKNVAQPVERVIESAVKCRVPYWEW